MKTKKTWSQIVTRFFAFRVIVCWETLHFLQVCISCKFAFPVSWILLQEDVLENKQYCENIHQRSDLLCFATYQIDDDIRDYTDCDTL